MILMCLSQGKLKVEKTFSQGYNTSCYIRLEECGRTLILLQKGW